MVVNCILFASSLQPFLTTCFKLTTPPVSPEAALPRLVALCVKLTFPSTENQQYLKLLNLVVSGNYSRYNHTSRNSIRYLGHKVFEPSLRAGLIMKTQRTVDGIPYDLSRVHPFE